MSSVITQTWPALVIYNEIEEFCTRSQTDIGEIICGLSEVTFEFTKL